jgi:hypothetical protein
MAAKEIAMRTCDQPALGWTLVLRRQPVRTVESWPEDGYTDVFELICCDCGDHPDLDYRDLSAELQRIRGPYPLATGIAAYGKHLALNHEPIPGSLVATHVGRGQRDRADCSKGKM